MSVSCICVCVCSSVLKRNETGLRVMCNASWSSINQSFAGGFLPGQCDAMLTRDMQNHKHLFNHCQEKTECKCVSLSFRGLVWRSGDAPKDPGQVSLRMLLGEMHKHASIMLERWHSGWRTVWKDEDRRRPASWCQQARFWFDGNARGRSMMIRIHDSKWRVYGCPELAETIIQSVAPHEPS